MNKKILVIVITAVVVVAVVVAGVYLATSPGGDGGDGGNGSGDGDGDGDGEGVINPEIAGATSLQFSAELTAKGYPPITYKYSANKIGTLSMMIRVEITSSEANFTYIVNKAQETAWAYENNTWTDISADFPTQWNTWNTTWTEHKNKLLSWTGSGDWTYKEPNGVTVRIFSIVVNPSFEEWLFQPG